MSDPLFLIGWAGVLCAASFCIGRSWGRAKGHALGFREGEERGFLAGRRSERQESAAGHTFRTPLTLAAYAQLSRRTDRGSK